MPPLQLPGEGQNGQARLEVQSQGPRPRQRDLHEGRDRPGHRGHLGRQVHGQGPQQCASGPHAQGLADFFVKYGSAEGQLVLDPFMGSGTTGIAAALLGRDYVGYELSPTYAEQARLRCEQAQAHWLQAQQKAS
ncbi:MAG: hypothetical protein CMH55_00520 [Myxococcales bacterium]|nr:hypothetical protein [Myxococcales bacterium]